MTKVLFLPHAGGYADLYNKFRPVLGSSFTPVTVEYPGHGRRFREPLLTTMEALTAKVFDDYLGNFNGDYIIFGHSMGGRVAYLLTHKIWEAGLPLPTCLFMSASPVMDAKHRNPDEVDFRTVTGVGNSEGGAGKNSKELDQLRELFYPIVRADLEALHNYVHVPKRQLPVPLRVIYSLEDEFDEFKESDYLAWERDTVADIEFRRFSGNHFFIFDHLEAIGGMIREAAGR
jgi:surfactin synthase thioesterase subunit